MLMKGSANGVKFLLKSSSQSYPNLPWVPEPQNLNERKLVKGKERRKKGGSGQMITQPRFGVGISKLYY